MNAVTTVKQVTKVLAYERHWNLHEPLAMVQLLNRDAVGIYYRRLPVCELSCLELVRREVWPIVEYICGTIETWLPLTLGWLGEGRAVVWS